MFRLALILFISFYPLYASVTLDVHNRTVTSTEYIIFKRLL